jgi:hypothetical protein
MTIITFIAIIRTLSLNWFYATAPETLVSNKLEGCGVCSMLGLLFAWLEKSRLMKLQYRFIIENN